jgi:hypothetical protein
MEQDGLHATVNEKNGTGDNWYQTVQQKWLVELAISTYINTGKL